MTQEKGRNHCAFGSFVPSSLLSTYLMSVTAVFGCYEHSIFGFEIINDRIKDEEEDEDLENDTTEEEEEEPLVLKQIFAYASHLGAVKSVASSGKTLVTGASDEVINIYDLKKLREVGQLHNHGGSITVVAFAGHNNTHMISGSADGVMCLWKCNKDWTCLHTIRVHTGEVISLALHPSSRLALSVGADKLLKIWNLLTGKLSHSLTLEHIPSQVLFNPSGTLFAIVFPDPKQILLYNLEGKLTRTLTFPHRITTAAFLNDTRIAAAGEEGSIGVWSTEKGFLHAINLAGVARIKTLTTLPDLSRLLKKELHESLPHVLLGCSDGLVIVLGLTNGTILATTQTNARLTCAAVTTVTRGPLPTTNGEPAKEEEPHAKHKATPDNQKEANNKQPANKNTKDNKKAKKDETQPKPKQPKKKEDDSKEEEETPKAKQPKKKQQKKKAVEVKQEEEEEEVAEEEEEEKTPPAKNKKTTQAKPKPTTTPTKPKSILKNASTPTPPKAAGTKRKHEEENASVNKNKKKGK